MALSFVFVVVGLIGLYFGGELLVRGASRIAVTLGLTPLAIGLTVVAIGTSAPELLVNGLAAWQQCDWFKRRQYRPDPGRYRSHCGHHRPVQRGQTAHSDYDRRQLDCCHHDL